MLKRTPLNRGTSTLKRGPIKKVSKKRLTEIVDMVSDIHLMHEFFMSIWNSREHKSEVSGAPIHGEPLTVYFHHILPKSKYPDLKLCKDNIIILTFNEHQEVETNPNRYEKINILKEQLKVRYGK